MVRTYKRKGNWQIESPSRMQEALDAVASGESIRKASERFGINFETLRRHSKNIKLDPKYSCNSFSDAEEQTLVEYFQKIARMGFPLEARTVRSLAYELAERNNKSCPSAWNERGLAGKDLMTSFLCRHNEALSLRTPEATSVARAAAFNEQNLKAFFCKTSRGVRKTQPHSWKNLQCWWDRTDHIPKTNTCCCRSWLQASATSGFSWEGRDSHFMCICKCNWQHSSSMPAWSFPGSDFTIVWLQGHRLVHWVWAVLVAGWQPSCSWSVWDTLSNMSGAPKLRGHCCCWTTMRATCLLKPLTFVVTTESSFWHSHPTVPTDCSR